MSQHSNDKGHGETHDGTALFEYHPMFLLGSLDPLIGPAIGGTVVTLSLTSATAANKSTETFGSMRNVSDASSEWQFVFDPVRDTGARCLFNDTSVAATVVSNSSVECVAPPTVPGGGVSLVRLSLNGADLFDNEAYGGGSYLRFLYLPDEREMSLFPANGPIKGGTLVEVSSRHIFEAAALFLSATVEQTDEVQLSAQNMNNASNPVGLPLSLVMCSFGGVTMPALGISFRWRGITDVEGGERSTHVGVVLCVSPPAPDDVPSRVSVEVSLDGGNDFTQHGAQFHYRPEAYVSGLEPAYGPVTGGNIVRVEGGPFRDEGIGEEISKQLLRCKFGDKEVGATVHTTELVSCRAPPMSLVPEEQDIEV